jgi:phosphopantothenoylcysteine decarboxylase/phosphopantothenate--cysteine ligase
VGVSGGIAAYKSAELVRLLRKQGAQVRVMMSVNAQAFVGPTTFEALSGTPVVSSLFAGPGRSEASIQHIEWAREAQGVVLAPATANLIGKLANGIADDALSTFLMAVTAPILVCPAMNSHMLASPAVQRNLTQLRADGRNVMEPDAGELACGTSGPGRLPDPERIADRLAALLTPQDFQGRRVLVTAGPTQEPMDPVRYVSNPSSGKMGFALARAAEHRGAQVTLVTGPTHLNPPLNTEIVAVRTAAEMARAVFQRMDTMDLLIMTAAVSDYRPLNPADQKMKKGLDRLRVEMERTTDILATVGKRKKNRIVVGFAAETQNLDVHAAAKLKAKNADLMVGNRVDRGDAGFQADTNQVTLYFRDRPPETLPLMSKAELAHHLLDRILKLELPFPVMV